MTVPSCSSFGFWSLFIFCNLSVIVNANIHEDDGAWLNPYDMLYDPTSKCMRKPTEVTLKMSLRVFKRFLTELLKETSKLGLVCDSVSHLFHFQIFSLMMDRHPTIGQLEPWMSQILVRFKLHDHEAWKWRFEDTFYVDADTALKVSLIVLIVVAIICTKLWSVVSWLVEFWRMFAVCFFISLIWNWFHLYMVIILVLLTVYDMFFKAVLNR
uniref:Chloride channel CLIC-like protein 1 n=1 Tax=Cyprinus carpio carpio TaxID=630221 RepID=A0A8C1AU58_CYPCA